MNSSNSDLMTTRELADLLRVTPGTIKIARSRGTGPGGFPPFPYLRLGRNIRYRRDQVMRILQANEVDPGGA